MQASRGERSNLGFGANSGSLLQPRWPWILLITAAATLNRVQCLQLCRRAVMGDTRPGVARAYSRLPSGCSAAVSGSRVSPGAGGTGEVGRDDVGGVAVQRAAGPVVTAGLARIGVPRKVLHITQAAASVESGGDRGVPQ